MINSTLCHILKDGKYLMLHRTKKKNDVNEDKWVGIGGKFEDKESPEECNKREVFEETGLTLNSACYRGIVTFVSNKWETEYMHIFKTNDYKGDIKECDEGELCWVDVKDIYNLPIWAGDKIFLKLIEDDNYPFFSLKLCYEDDTLIFASLNNKILNFEDFI